MPTTQNDINKEEGKGSGGCRGEIKARQGHRKDPEWKERAPKSNINFNGAV